MRRPGLSLGAVLLVAASVAVSPLIGRVRRSWPWRVAVAGHSMEPRLSAGDWLLVDPLAYTGRNPQAGELVVGRDPRRPDRWLVKRAARITADGRVVLSGDHPAHAQDDIPPLEPEDIIGQPWLRYWPPSRLGRLV